ncbi:MAG TPA: GxxExxY protein [Bacteroidales bacterium]|nr:GxxExxY protein [Bacteroidales bacterium]HRZ50147.1 GxxExxY protein [Bacteroidales bacterium]
MNDLLHKELTNRILNCFFKVYNTLDFGFLEKVYENAILVELKEQGLKADKQKKINVYYNNITVGEYFTDIIVEDTIIVELKASECLIKENELQLINYLKATDKEVGLLLNFGKNPEFRRKIFTNDRKSQKPMTRF